MWARAAGLSDAELVGFDLQQDLVLCRSGPTSYGTIILGKIRVPAINDDEGEGFIHVRWVFYIIFSIDALGVRGPPVALSLL